ncbi:hypothetical protein [Actinomadura alba]|uniref:hypothetical protein n=1 Tax=Actinomadura alba TaxID=406431 RepID=UPI00406BB68C
MVDIRAAAADVARVVSHWGRVEALDDASCRLHMSVDTFEWPTVVLTSVGADFEVVRPAELRDYLRATGERFARAGSRLGSARPEEN